LDNQFIIEQIRQNAIPLQSHQDLQAVVDAIGDAKIVLLGEASHGTSEFYTLRTELTKQLIEQKGFSFMAVEGDWPSSYHINRYIKQYSDAYRSTIEVMEQFKRCPGWMWSNQEVVQLIEWLRGYNDKKTDQAKFGFYGLDMYSLWESMEEIIRYLKTSNATEDQLELAEKAFSCFEPYGGDEQLYGITSWAEETNCTDEVVKLLKEMQFKRQHAYPKEAEHALSAELNALVAVHAEQYYRSMIGGGPESWNIRDRHMTEALQKLMSFHGKEAKAIVWEHNTHIGDARATDMKRDGMINVGQLVRESYSKNDVFSVGFATGKGTVIAGTAWGSPAKIMKVPAAIKNSWEYLFHQANPTDQIFIFNPNHDSMKSNRGHRAIGVVYHPEMELGNYVPTRLSDRYDAFIYLEETHALKPLEFVEQQQPVLNYL
jgi:erythromycin esterase-like protein